MAVVGATAFLAPSLVNGPTPFLVPSGQLQLQAAGSNQQGSQFGLVGGMGMAVAAAVVRKAFQRSGRMERVVRCARGGAFDPSTQPGAIEPLGFWDPCGFTKDKTEEEFNELRGYELKHGRVAMMAIVGFLGQHFWKFPYTADVPNGTQAAYTYPGSVGLGFLFLVTGFLELRVLPERETTPGNFGDPFGIINNKLIGGYDDRWRNMELSNSRLAMVGAIGTIVAGAYTGLDAFEQWDKARPVAIDFVKRTIPFAP